MTPTRHDQQSQPLRSEAADVPPRLDRGVVGITAVAGVLVALATTLASLAWSSIRGELGETREAMKALTSEVTLLRREFAAGETARARIEERVEALRALDRERRKEKP